MKRRTHGLLGVAVIGLLGLMASAAFGQTNLLYNGGFDVENLTGTDPNGHWVKWGSTAMTNKRSDKLDAWIFQPDVCGAVGNGVSCDGRVIDGNYSYKCGQLYQAGGTKAGIYQWVAVTPGQQYTLQFYWHYDSWEPTGDTHIVGISDGSIVPDGNQSWLYRAVRTDQKYGNWEVVTSTTVTPTTSTLTVWIHTEFGSGSGDKGVGTWADAFTLVQGTINQHELANSTPMYHRGNTGNAVVTVNGTNLTGANVAQLVPVSTGTTINGTIDTNNGTSMQVTFPMSTVSVGEVYNLVVKKPLVSDRTLNNAMTILAAGGNLLTNGGFENSVGGSPGEVATPIDWTTNLNNPPIYGWTRWTGGWANPPTSRVSSACELWCPQTIPAIDTYSFREGGYSGAMGDTGLRQVIPVVAGESLTLSFQWGGHIAGSATKTDIAFEVGVFSGNRTNPSTGSGDLGVLRYDYRRIASSLNLTSFGWETRTITFTVPAGVNEITVYNKLWDADGDWAYVYFYTDAFSLSPSPTCANQHTLVSIDPVQAPTNYNYVDITITGTNLDQVDHVRLARGQDQYPAEYPFVAQSSTSLTARFQIPAGGAIEGDYDVITEQAGCTAKSLTNAFHFGCDPVVLTSVSPSTLTKPVTEVELTINGTSISSLDQVILEWLPPSSRAGNHPWTVADPLNPGETIPLEAGEWWNYDAESNVRRFVGTLVDDTNPNAVVYSFNLGTAQIGQYRLMGKFPSGTTCSDPAPVSPAFTLDAPSGSDLILNPGFDTGSDAPSDWTLESMGGDTDRPEWCGGPIPKPGPVWADINWPWTGAQKIYPRSDPKFIGTYAGHDFDHCTIWNTVDGGTIRQFVGGPGEYSISAQAHVLLRDHDTPGSWIKLSIVVDGFPATSSKVALSGYGLLTADWYDGWTLLSADWIGEALEGVEIEVETYANAGEWAFLGVDDMALYGTMPTCDSPPTVVTVVPNTGQQEATVNVTITGTNLVPAGTTVWLEKSGVVDKIYATSVNVAGDGLSLTCQIAIPTAAVAGAWDVVVQTSGPACQGKKFGGFTITEKPACGTPPQNVDGDADVDLVDFGQFQACFNGPNREYKIQSPPEAKQKCTCVDVDHDNDVDLVDFGAFQGCFNGPNRPPKC